MNEDYVRTARAKGLTERQVMIRHVLRNSLIPIVTLFGLDFGAVIGGGAILTETVFNLQGVGQYAAESIGQLDVPPMMAMTMFGAFFIVLLNAIVDIAYAYLDPRIRLAADVAPSRCSRSTTCGSASPPRRASCRRSTACPSTSRRARCWRSSASRAPASSVTAQTLIGLTRSPQRAVRGLGRATRATELIDASDDELRRVRGDRDRDDLPGPDDLAQPGPRGSATQIVEAIQAHEALPRPAGARAGDRAARRGRASRAPRERVDDYPHEFSGGMRQRVMIAMALSLRARAC